MGWDGDGIMGNMGMVIGDDDGDGSGDSAGDEDVDGDDGGDGDGDGDEFVRLIPLYDVCALTPIYRHPFRDAMQLDPLDPPKESPVVMVTEMVVVMVMEMEMEMAMIPDVHESCQS